MQWEGEGTLCKVRGLLDSLASCGRHDHAGTHAPSVRDAGFITGLSRDGLDASRLASSAVSLFSSRSTLLQAEIYNGSHGGIMTKRYVGCDDVRSICKMRYTSANLSTT